MSEKDTFNTLRPVLKRQYHAALTMLKQAIERCPEELWIDDQYANQFWQLAYHTLYYTHLYLQPDAASFTPWEHHQTYIQDLDEFRAPTEIQDLCEHPHRPPQTGELYSKSQVLEYWGVCDVMVDDCVKMLDLGASTCGFPWYDMTKLEHQFVTVRHIQHHTAQLGVRLREASGIAIDWIGSG
ncbi:MAG: hypothetical protein O7G85_15295 [Planctomycetota bacterium]|nr:hypothetical protein [Planctomycetota bacterium]